MAMPRCIHWFVSAFSAAAQLKPLYIVLGSNCDETIAVWSVSTMMRLGELVESVFGLLPEFWRMSFRMASVPVGSDVAESPIGVM